MALIFDPMDDLADVVGQIEDFLLFVEPDTDDDVAVLDAGAHAAGNLTLALREARTAAPTLIAPDGHSELGPVLRCPAASLPAILRAVEAAPADELHDRVRAGRAALGLIEQCLPHDPGPAGAERDQAVREEARQRPEDNIVVPQTPLGSGRGRRPSRPARRLARRARSRWVLTADQYAAYRRLANTILHDVLDRFAMG